MAAVDDQPYKYQLQYFVRCPVFGLFEGYRQMGRKELGRRNDVELFRMNRNLNE
jgi:hypothetical protein